MTIELIKTYYANDGTPFYTEEKALAHEKALALLENQTNYYCIKHHPDLTEGRGFERTTYLKVIVREIYLTGIIPNIVIDWCIANIGRATVVGPGNYLEANWVMIKINTAKYEKEQLGKSFDERVLIDCR